VENKCINVPNPTVSSNAEKRIFNNDTNHRTAIESFLGDIQQGKISHQEMSLIKMNLNII
jgi:hypothetical protein